MSSWKWGRGQRRSRAPVATHLTSIVILIVSLEAKRRRPEFIRGCSQPPLGLDAGLDGGVGTDEVQGDVAHQCQVVGDMAAAGTGVVVAKLNVQAPVPPVLDFPMAAHRAHELPGVGGHAADVAAALDARPVTDASSTLDQGKALQVAPLEPIAGLEGPTTLPFLPTMPPIVALPTRDGLQGPADTRLGQQDCVEQLRMVVFYAQHIVGATLADLAGDGCLGAHSINGDDAAG